MFNIIIVFSLLFYGCNESKESIDEIKNDRSYNGKENIIQNEENYPDESLGQTRLYPEFFNSRISNQLGTVSDLQVIDNKLVILSDHNDGYISVYEIFDSDLEFLFQVGSKGLGPHEFMDVPSMVSIMGNSTEIIQFYDFRTKRIVTADYEYFFQNGQLSQTFFVPSEISSIQQVALISNDSVFVGQGGIQQGKLVRIYRDNNANHKFSSFNPDLPGVSTIARKAHIFEGTFAIHETKERIISVSKYFDQIEFFDLELNQLKIVTSSLSEPIQIDIIRGEPLIIPGETLLRYTDLDFSEEYIFVLDAKRPVGTSEPCENSELIIFDWDGKFRNKIGLNGCPTRITYDDQNHRILSFYAFTDGVDKYLGFYDLPDF